MRFLELRVPPVLVVAAVAVLMWLVARLTPSLRVDLPGRGVVALVLLTSGAAIAWAGVSSFRRASTTVNPIRPQDASSLVTSGVYRFTRNPMYLGLLLALLGWAAWLAHPLALLVALLFVPYMGRFQIAPEERALRAAFGKDFETYARRTRRWL